MRLKSEVKTEELSELELLRRENYLLKLDLLRNKKSKRHLSLKRDSDEMRLESMKLLQEIVEKINSVDDIPKLFDEIGKMINKIVPHEVSSLFLYQTKKIYINSKLPVSEQLEEQIKWGMIDIYNKFSGEDISEDVEFNINKKELYSYLSVDDIGELHEVIMIPVFTREECMGAIGIFANRELFITREQTNNFIEIVRITSMLLDNAVLYDKILVTNQKLENKIHSLNHILEISQGLSGDMGHEELIDFILSVAMQEIDADGGSLMLVDHRKRELRLESIKGLPETFKSTFKMKMGEGIAGLVAEEGEPWILLDLPLESDEIKKKYSKYTVKFFPFDKYQERSGVISAISIPLVNKQEVIGVLNLTSSEKIFTEEDLETVMLFGSMASNSIRNNRLLELEEKRIKELMKFSDIGKMLSSTFDQSEIFNMIIDTLNTILKFNVALILVEDIDRFVLTVVSTCNVTSRVVEKLKENLVKKFERVSGRNIDLDSVEISFKKIGNMQVEISNEKFDSIIDSAFAMKGRTRGIISLLAFEYDFFDEEDERTLITFASTIAVAMENSITYEKMERTVKELSTLFEVSKSMTSLLDLEDVLNMIVNISAELMDARILFLRLPNSNNELEVKAHFGEFDKSLEELIIPVGVGITGRAFSEKRLVVVNKISSTKLIENKDVLLSHGVNSCISVPLIIKEKSIGVVTCFFDEEKMFSDSERNLLMALASHASIAIENAKMYEEMNTNYTDTIMALAAAIDAKDHYTHGHSKNVMEYSVAIAKELGLSREEIENVKFAGLLHDIGKIGIPESILRKSSNLTDEEFHVICTHPQLGAAIMEQVKFLKKLSPLAYHHHEKFDGTGYPDGLKGEEIPLGARILNLSDSFDVMTTSRVYKSAMQFESALEEVKRCSGKQFDPKVVEAFFKVIDKVFKEIKKSDVNCIVELVRNSHKSELI